MRGKITADPGSAEGDRTVRHVWIDWGSGRRVEISHYEFATGQEVAAFIEGVEIAIHCLGAEDVRVYDAKKELDEAELIED